MFRVEWIQAALDDLTTIWIDADSERRQLINRMSEAIDRELQVDPYRSSESRGDGEDRQRIAPVLRLGRARIEQNYH